jgi:hypothetical protein
MWTYPVDPTRSKMTYSFSTPASAAAALARLSCDEVAAALEAAGLSPEVLVSAH